MGYADVSDDANEIRATVCSMPRRPRVVSELELLHFIGSRAAGVTVDDVVEAFGGSAESARRSLKRVADSKVGVTRTRGYTERDRYRFEASGRLGPEQRWALSIVRELLTGLNGTRLVTALDAVTDDAPAIPVELDSSVSIEDPAVSAVVYEAVSRKRRLRLTYSGIKDATPRARFVEVHHLKQMGGAWYATVTDLDSPEKKTKTFKVARMTNPRMTNEPCKHKVVVDDIYEHSVGIWEGPLQHVRVRLTGDATRLAHEYKLNITQREERVGEDVVVTATVAGLDETARWIWRWGRQAQALSPPELVERCASELRAAAARYG